LEEIKMPSYLIIAQILVALALIVVVMLQVKGSGLGGIFGQPDSVYRTRRGVEKSLYQMTIGLAILFVILSILVVSLKV
jgi:preprotein translocase subunit SecG